MPPNDTQCVGQNTSMKWLPDLPELHLYGGVKLCEAGLQVHGLGLGVVQVDGRLLVLVLVHVTQVGSQL